jgi:hypothetical protein
MLQSSRRSLTTANGFRRYGRLCATMFGRKRGRKIGLASAGSSPARDDRCSECSPDHIATPWPRLSGALLRRRRGGAVRSVEGYRPLLMTWSPRRRSGQQTTNPSRRSQKYLGFSWRDSNMYSAVAEQHPIRNWIIEFQNCLNELGFLNTNCSRPVRIPLRRNPATASFHLRNKSIVFDADLTRQLSLR